MFIPLLLFRYRLLFAVHVDLNSKIVIDSNLILKEKEKRKRYVSIGTLIYIKMIIGRFTDETGIYKSGK